MSAENYRRIGTGALSMNLVLGFYLFLKLTLHGEAIAFLGMPNTNAISPARILIADLLLIQANELGPRCWS